MKQSLHISLIFLFLTAAFSDGIIMLRFQLQREALTERYCININAPEKMCSGICYLGDQLEEQHDRERQIPGLSLSEKSPIVYITPTLSRVHQYIETIPLATANYVYQSYDDQVDGTTLLRPPRTVS